MSLLSSTIRMAEVCSGTGRARGFFGEDAGAMDMGGTRAGESSCRIAQPRGLSGTGALIVTEDAGRVAVSRSVDWTVAVQDTRVVREPDVGVEIYVAAMAQRILWAV